MSPCLSTVLPFFLLLLLLQVSAQTLRPHAYPLVVRSPYLNTWVKFGTDSSPSRNWPTFYPQNGQNLGWAGIVQVDNVNTTFSFMGRVSSPASLEGAQLTPTQTIFTWTAGPVRLTVNYLSPIEPDDWVKMSFPFAYVSITAASLDRQPHEVRLYCDMSGEFVSNADNVVIWDTVQTTKSLYHWMEQRSPSFLAENAGFGEDGTTYHAVRLNSNVSWRTGSDGNSRSQFVENGRLANTKDTNFRRLRNAWPVMALSIDLGQVSTETDPVVWAVGKTRDPAIQFRGRSGLQQRSSLFRATYDDISVAIDDFLEDFPNAKRRADELDRKIQGDAQRVVSPAYAQLLALATRQTFAATELTIAKGSDGAWNHSDIKMFMREMGTGRTVNPVDLMYASFPAFLYFNSTLAGRLLEPLLEYQSTGDYTNEFAAPNLGTSYPNATGNAIVHPQGVEHSGNMIIMALAHAKFSGDGSLLLRYYPLLKKWAEYLVKNAFSPIGQTSADGLSNGNMTNLAIKGIIGVQAMSEISAAVKETADSQRFADTAAMLVGNWSQAASTGNHLASIYGDSSSTGLIYNLYADRLLRTDLVAQSVLDVQTEFYRTRMSNNPATFGLPVDSDEKLANVIKSHWVMMAAAATTNSDVRDMLIESVHARAGSPDYQGAFPSTYLSGTGEMQDGAASAAQGAMFAVLALDLEAQEIRSDALGKSGEGEDEEGGATNVGAIAGGVVGGVVAIAGLVGLLFFLRRRRNIRDDNSEKLHPTPFNTQPTQPYTDDYHSSVALPQTSSGQLVYSGAQPGGNQFQYEDNQSGSNQYGGNQYGGNQYGAVQYGHSDSQGVNAQRGYGETQPATAQYAHNQYVPNQYAHSASQSGSYQYTSHSVPDQANSSSSQPGHPPTQYSVSSMDHHVASHPGSNHEDLDRIGMFMTNPHSVTSSSVSDDRSQRILPTPPTSTGRRSSISKGDRGYAAARSGYTPSNGAYRSPAAPASEVPPSSSRSDGALQDDVAAQLRQEVESLRQQVSSLRQEREFDAPPEYVPPSR